MMNNIKEKLDLNKKLVLIHCQYVYGIGHFVRSIELATALLEFFNVVIVNGGEHISNYEIDERIILIKIPAIFKMEVSNELVSVDESLTLNECYSKRTNIINDFLMEFRVDILITEHYPFGLLFHDEVISLIDKVRALNEHAKVICSVRDVIESGNNERNNKICRILNNVYNAILVHGDERIISFGDTFPSSESINIPIYHTGYVVQRKFTEKNKSEETPTLVVSIGGGRLGQELLHALIVSHELIFEKLGYKTILFTGAFQSNDILELLQSSTIDKSIIEINSFSKVTYQEKVFAASAIICMGGYNSLIECVSLNVPVLIYNRSFLQNDEQELRLKFFKKNGLIETISESELTPERIIEKLLMCVPSEKRRLVELNNKGADFSSEILKKLVNI